MRSEEDEEAVEEVEDMVMETVELEEEVEDMWMWQGKRR